MFSFKSLTQNAKQWQMAVSKYYPLGDVRSFIHTTSGSFNLLMPSTYIFMQSAHPHLQVLFTRYRESPGKAC